MRRLSIAALLLAPCFASDPKLTNLPRAQPTISGSSFTRLPEGRDLLGANQGLGLVF